MQRSEFTLNGYAGRLAGVRWSAGPSARKPWYIAILVHGYGEHIARYEHVAARLVADDAVVYGHDHVGHGRSDGERVAIADFEPVVDDVRRCVDLARRENPDLPIILVGHSMGGMIVARYAQLFSEDLAAVVLSGPVIGRWAAVDALLASDPIPDAPIDPATLSRDPAVGAAYADDPLVWHGAFKRPTLEALRTMIHAINTDGPLRLPALWVHGEDDQLVPIEGSREGWQRLTGGQGAEITYPRARHEVFNEINSADVLGDVVEFIHGVVEEALRAVDAEV